MSEIKQALVLHNYIYKGRGEYLTHYSTVLNPIAIIAWKVHTFVAILYTNAIGGLTNAISGLANVH